MGAAMLSRRIIPCLDVREGRVVKGVKFRDHVDMGDIVELAMRYRRAHQRPTRNGVVAASAPSAIPR